MSLDDHLPPFVREYPIGSGFLTVALFYATVQPAAVGPAWLLVGAWVGWILRGDIPGSRARRPAIHPATRFNTTEPGSR